MALVVTHGVVDKLDPVHIAYYNSLKSYWLEKEFSSMKVEYASPAVEIISGYSPAESYAGIISGDKQYHGPFFV